MSTKPHRGTITGWYRFPDTAEGLGFRIIGKFEQHERLAGMRAKTSVVVKYDEKTGEIETSNSRYTLVGPEYQEKP